jgi:steroid 5-alpha reductase family enzyme
MVVLYLEALVAIALSLAILMVIAWMVQQRTGNSCWVDTIWTFSVGLSGAGSALWPVGGAAPNARQWLVAALMAICGERYRDYHSRSSAFFPLPPHNGVVT